MIGVAWPQLLTSVVSFTILVILLYRFLYTPLSKMMSERSQKIKDSLDAAEKAREEVADATDRIENDIREARHQAAGIINEARVSARKFAEQENERTRQQVQDTLTKAQSEIERQKVAAIEEVRQEFGELAVIAAEKIIRTKIDRKSNQQLIESVLDDVVSQHDRNN